MAFLKKKEEIYKWEPIDDESDRLKVPGGWIVRSCIKFGTPSVHQVFVEDPSHLWKLEDIE